MSSSVIFDTSVLVDQLRTGRHTARIQTLTGLIRTSAVVLGELWRGASTSPERRFLRTLEKNHPVLVPTAKHWVESGEILARVRSEKGFSPEKLRDLHFDALIALSARALGGLLITSNRNDFELIANYVQVHLEIWP